MAPKISAYMQLTIPQFFGMDNSNSLKKKKKA